jgi:hypothetical protein
MADLFIAPICLVYHEDDDEATLADLDRRAREMIDHTIKRAGVQPVTPIAYVRLTLAQLGEWTTHEEGTRAALIFRFGQDAPYLCGIMLVNQPLAWSGGIGYMPTEKALKRAQERTKERLEQARGASPAEAPAEAPTDGPR